MTVGLAWSIICLTVLILIVLILKRYWNTFGKTLVISVGMILFIAFSIGLTVLVYIFCDLFFRGNEFSDIISAFFSIITLIFCGIIGYLFIKGNEKAKIASSIMTVSMILISIFFIIPAIFFIIFMMTCFGGIKF